MGDVALLFWAGFFCGFWTCVVVEAFAWHLSRTSSRNS